jgi:hypothetical protein
VLGDRLVDERLDVVRQRRLGHAAPPLLINAQWVLGDQDLDVFTVS